MADPDLVDYLRRNLPRFGADALRAKLLEEEVAAADVDAALAEAARTQRRGPRLAPALAGAAVLAAALAYLALVRAPAPETPPPARPAPAAGGEAERVFHGHYGFLVQLPPGYDALSDFRDPQKTVEVVYLFPQGTDPTHFGNEKLYGQLGILRLEVTPRRSAEGLIGLEAVRSGVANTLRSRKANFDARELQLGGLPAFLVVIREPSPLAQAFVLGSNVLYVLTGGVEDRKFSDILYSLHEAVPGDRLPAGEAEP